VAGSDAYEPEVGREQRLFGRLGERDEDGGIDREVAAELPGAVSRMKSRHAELSMTIRSTPSCR
jgi:hypothetical protein